MDGITNQDVLTDSSPADSEVVKPQEQEVKAPEAAKQPASAPGSKTPENNLLAALHEERVEKQKLAERIKQLEASMSSTKPDDEIFSDEGKLLQGSISSLELKIKELEQEKELDHILSKHPEIKDVSDEFKTFRTSYPGVSLEDQAQLFLVKKGIHPGLARKGLEQGSGGVKTAPPAAMSDDDLKRLREESPRKYLQLVSEGKI